MKALGNILHSFQYPQELLVVEYQFGGSSHLISVAHLKLRGEEVDLIGAKTLQDLQDLSAAFPQLPCVILFTGKKILSKNLSLGSEKYGNEELINRAFPNIQQDDLIFDIQDLDKGSVVVSAARKDAVLQVLENWPKMFMPVDLSLGVFAVWPLLAGLQGEQIKLGAHSIDLISGETEMLLEQTSQPIELFGQEIDSELGLPFLFGILKLSERAFISTLPQVMHHRSEWRYSRLFKKGLAGSAVTVFILLLISFVMFSHYSSKVGELSYSTQAYDQQLTELSSLKETYQTKKQFLEVNGSQSFAASKMADAIAGIVPKGVALKRLAFNPVERHLKKENLVRFSRDKILVKGESESYSDFQQWLTALKSLEWLGKLEILGYEEADKGNAAIFEVSISTGYE